MRGNVAKGSDKTRGDTLIPDTSFATPTHAQSITTVDVRVRVHRCPKSCAQVPSGDSAGVCPVWTGIPLSASCGSTAAEQSPDFAGQFD